MAAVRRVLLSLATVVALVAVLHGLLRLLGTAAIADAHLRSVARVEAITTVLVAALIAFFAGRAAARRVK
jgi:hypothetical protein